MNQVVWEFDRDLPSWSWFLNKIQISADLLHYSSLLYSALYCNRIDFYDFKEKGEARDLARTTINRVWFIRVSPIFTAFPESDWLIFVRDSIGVEVGVRFRDRSRHVSVSRFTSSLNASPLASPKRSFRIRFRFDFDYGELCIHASAFPVLNNPTPYLVFT